MATRAILFDLDGTLVDTMFKFADLAADVMHKRHGADLASARERYLTTSGIPFAQQLEVIFPGHSENGAASDEFEFRKRAITASTQMDDRSRAGLAELRRLGMLLVVSSNTGQPFVDEFIAGESMPFDLALGFDAATHLAKGEPHFARAEAELGVSRAEMLFVGDSLKDGELAAAAGIAFVGRLGTFDVQAFDRHHPGAPTVDNVDQLPALLRAMAAAAA